ncbi:hypothetical protein GPECTOR_21g659 [Gonium pectorale]|uniref:EF-hand domain-containing protein n=1 Tax=Gonium pectorale TaxID=33097 RepID=A0A150GI07_GONPE|nr:hypothetical protein GPECTOR_21g659 [Gonium pectorale]|eukprot:KXZ49433.1 hypothetical protein GPECTOR_21g659 [Gonium pectorale]
MKEVFQLFDTEDKGYFTKDDLFFVMEAMGKNPTPEALHSVMAELDINGDSVVDFPEFLTRFHTAMTEDELLKVFNALSRASKSDKRALVDDRMVTLQAIQRSFQYVGDPLTEEDLMYLEDIFKGADKDGNGCLDIREFTAYLERIDDELFLGQAAGGLAGAASSGLQGLVMALASQPLASSRTLSAGFPHAAASRVPSKAISLVRSGALGLLLSRSVTASSRVADVEEQVQVHVLGERLSTGSAWPQPLGSGRPSCSREISTATMREAAAAGLAGPDSGQAAGLTPGSAFWAAAAAAAAREEQEGGRHSLLAKMTRRGSGGRRGSGSLSALGSYLASLGGGACGSGRRRAHGSGLGTATSVGGGAWGHSPGATACAGGDGQLRLASSFRSAAADDMASASSLLYPLRAQGQPATGLATGDATGATDSGVVAPPISRAGSSGGGSSAWLAAAGGGGTGGAAGSAVSSATALYTVPDPADGAAAGAAGPSGRGRAAPQGPPQNPQHPWSIHGSPPLLSSPVPPQLGSNRECAAVGSGPLCPDGCASPLAGGAPPPPHAPRRGFTSRTGSLRAAPSPRLAAHIIQEAPEEGEAGLPPVEAAVAAAVASATAGSGGAGALGRPVLGSLARVTSFPSKLPSRQAADNEEEVVVLGSAGVDAEGGAPSRRPGMPLRLGSAGDGRRGSRLGWGGVVASVFTRQRSLGLGWPSGRQPQASGAGGLPPGPSPLQPRGSSTGGDAASRESGSPSPKRGSGNSPPGLEPTPAAAPAPARAHLGCQGEEPEPFLPARGHAHGIVGGSGGAVAEAVEAWEAVEAARTAPIAGPAAGRDLLPPRDTAAAAAPTRTGWGWGAGARAAPFTA